MRHAGALAVWAGCCVAATPGRVPMTRRRDLAVRLRAAMADDEIIDMGWPDPQARPGVPSRPTVRGFRSAGRSVAMARATIPTVLMLLFLLPALGIGWLMLPGDAPLKIGRPALAGGLIGFGIFCG